MFRTRPERPWYVLRELLMSSREPGAWMVPVVRAELVTRDMEVIAELTSHPSCPLQVLLRRGQPTRTTLDRTQRAQHLDLTVPVQRPAGDGVDLHPHPPG